jgi:hypothetical protein
VVTGYSGIAHFTSTDSQCRRQRARDGGAVSVA